MASESSLRALRGCWLVLAAVVISAGSSPLSTVCAEDDGQVDVFLVAHGSIQLHNGQELLYEQDVP